MACVSNTTCLRSNSLQLHGYVVRIWAMSRLGLLWTLVCKFSFLLAQNCYATEDPHLAFWSARLHRSHCRKLPFLPALQKSSYFCTALPAVITVTRLWPFLAILGWLMMIHIFCSFVCFVFCAGEGSPTLVHERQVFTAEAHSQLCCEVFMCSWLFLYLLWHMPV